MLTISVSDLKSIGLLADGREVLCKNIVVKKVNSTLSLDILGILSPEHEVALLLSRGHRFDVLLHTLLTVAHYRLVKLVKRTLAVVGCLEQTWVGHVLTLGLLNLGESLTHKSWISELLILSLRDLNMQIRAEGLNWFDLMVERILLYRRHVSWIS